MALRCGWCGAPAEFHPKRWWQRRARIRRHVCPLRQRTTVRRMWWVSLGWALLSLVVALEGLLWASLCFMLAAGLIGASWAYSIGWEHGAEHQKASDGGRDERA